MLFQGSDVRVYLGDKEIGKVESISIDLDTSPMPIPKTPMLEYNFDVKNPYSERKVKSSKWYRRRNKKYLQWFDIEYWC